jgi:MYXO-CTERM domain-containing protein
MLPLGYLGPRNEWHASAQTAFSRNEQVSIMTLWSMLPSPLMYGGNPARLSSDAWTLALLTNEEVLAVNQDPLGAHGRRTAVGSNEFWVRDLSGGRKAVAFFNRGTQDTMMSATFAQIGVTGMPVIRDLWNRMVVTAANNTLSASVPGGAALMYTLSPPSGMGGMGGMAGMSGMGGMSGAGTGGGSSGAGTGAGAGGVAGQGGVSGASGTSGGSGTSGVGGAGAASGGAAGTPGGASGTTGTGGATGGAATSGGVSGTTPTGGTAAGVAGAASGTTSSAASDSGGCGCAIPRPHRSASIALLLAAAALGARRRRRS